MERNQGNKSAKISLSTAFSIECIELTVTEMKKEG
jgi:hypothetical protein